MRPGDRGAAVGFSVHHVGLAWTAQTPTTDTRQISLSAVRSPMTTSRSFTLAATEDPAVRDCTASRALFGDTITSGADFVFAGAEESESIWGDGPTIAWSRGEPLIICGSPGVGKSTLAQQLMLARAGLAEPEFLGLRVEPDTERRVLYICADRPAQARKSIARMVTGEDKAVLDDRLLVAKGPPRTAFLREPALLANAAREQNVGTVVIDGLKDIAPNLSDEATAGSINLALQTLVAQDTELVALHHPRKGRTERVGDGKRPDPGAQGLHLDDVYGSTWLTAGAGSVIGLVGEPGAALVRFHHLKQPEQAVEPFDIFHHHSQGRSVRFGDEVLIEIVSASEGVAAPDIAASLHGAAKSSADIERVRRALDRLSGDGALRRDKSPEAGKTLYWGAE